MGDRSHLPCLDPPCAIIKMPSVAILTTPQEPPLYARHGLSASYYTISCSNEASDWKQIKDFYEWPLLEKLAERGRMNQATLKSLCCSLSLKPWISYKKLAKAHYQILLLHRQIRQGFVVTEEQEKIAYGRYAEALSRLEDLTGRYFQAFLGYATELDLFRLSISTLQTHNAQSYMPEEWLLQPTFSTDVLLPENKFRLKNKQQKNNSSGRGGYFIGVRN